MVLGTFFGHGGGGVPLLDFHHPEKIFLAFLISLAAAAVITGLIQVVWLFIKKKKRD